MYTRAPCPPPAPTPTARHPAAPHLALTRACGGRQLKRDDGDDDGVDADGDGESDEVGEVCDVLMSHVCRSCGSNLLRSRPRRPLLLCSRARGTRRRQAASVFAAFYHYALGEGGGARSIFRVQPGEWHAFVGDVGLAVAGSSHCDAPHLGILFVGVNAAGERVRRAEAQRERQEGRSSPRAGEAADSKSLCRGEWVELLVRVAVSRFVLSGELSDVSEAVKTLLEQASRAAAAALTIAAASTASRRAPPPAPPPPPPSAAAAPPPPPPPHPLWSRLLEQVVVPQLGRQVLHDANEFRRTCCYTEAVDAVLREHEQSLRAMFERYAAADSQGERDGTRWLGYAEWAEFVEDLGLIDGAFTLREATLCFACSRMLVVDETTPLGWRRTTNLTFEDFLEAFVRAALLKPLPTPAEVQKAGYRDAGEFVLKMRTDDPAGWNNWATKHTVTCAPAPPAPRGAPLRERRGSAAHRREGGMALRLPSQRAGLLCLSLSSPQQAAAGGRGRGAAVGAC